MTVGRGAIRNPDAANMDSRASKRLGPFHVSLLSGPHGEHWPSTSFYRPEMQSATDFKFSVTDEKLERFGATVLVRQVGTFSVSVGEELRAYRAAVSYVMIEDAGVLRIAHLHWSSRPQRTQ